MIRQQVSTVDLMPTLLDAAGLPAPADLHGSSFLPLVGGGTDPERPESVFLQISEFEVGRAVRTSRWKYAVTAPDANGWTEPSADRYVETCLYDLANDPYELDNLAGLTSHREVADSLRAMLLDWMRTVGEKEPVIEPAPERRPRGRRVDPEVHDFDLTGVRFAHQRPVA
nr:sulfatase/phosphatase domain-containing protein [Catenulispora rubra]